MKVSAWKLVTAFAAAALLITLSRPAAAVPTATATANASASIKPKIQITKTADLSFGDLVVDTGGGTATVSPAGTISTTGVNVQSLGGTISAASFNVTGAPSRAFLITLPVSGTITCTGGGTCAVGTDTITVNTFVSNPASPATLDGAGTATLDVGATLQLTGSEPDGNYSGTFNVTVQYQ